MRVNKPGISDAPVDTTLMFEGLSVPARHGESVAAALVSAGHFGLRRTRTGSDRGVFCGMGVCSECAVTINGESGRLACMEKVEPGLSVQRNPPKKQLDGTSSSALEDLTVECDVLIVGGGPSGLRAALMAARCGAKVVVTDERSALGGQYFKQPVSTLEVDDHSLDHQYRDGRLLIKSALDAGVDVRSGTRIWGARSPQEIFAVSPHCRLTLRASALILATGAYERGVPFPGWTLPGVMTTGAAQTLLRSYLVTPGERVLVAGNGPLNLQVASELTAAGVNVTAVVESAALWRPTNIVNLAGMASAAPAYFREGLSYLTTLLRARVPILARSAIVEVRGSERAEVGVTARLDDTGHAVAGSRKEFEVDAVCLGYGFVSSNELARSLGCRHRVDAKSGSLAAVRTKTGRTSVPGVWIVGDGGGVGGAQAAQSMGALAGIDAAQSVNYPPSAALVTEYRREERALAGHERFQRSLWRQFDAPRLRDQLATPETIICRCEEVTLAQLCEAAEPWLADAGSIKRVTRAGMGKCQGRYCAPIVSELASRASGTPIDEYSSFLPQSPFLPVRTASLATNDDFLSPPPEETNER